MWSLGLRLQWALAFCLSLSHACLCLQGADGSQLATLQYLLGCYPLFWVCLVSECDGMVLCFSDGPTNFPILSVLCHMIPLRVFSWHANLVFPWGLTTQSILMHPPPTRCRQTWACEMVIAIWHNLCGEFSRFCLIVPPSEVPKLSTMRQFLTVWKLLLLHNFLPRMGPD